ncbi:MAG: hypothetical protein AB7O49_11665 [Sphingomonadales bacterium]
MSLKGTPDWSSPLKAAGSDAWFAFEDPLRAFVPPAALAVAEEPGGAPALALELIRLSGAADGPRVFGLLNIGFAADFALADKQQAVFAAHPDVRVEPLMPRGGFLRFQAAEALNIHADLLSPKPLVWAGAGALTFAVQLGQPAAMLLNDALVNGLVTVTALAELETWGVASRVPARVTFNPAVLPSLVAGVAINGKVAPGALAAALVARADTPVLGFDGIGTDAERVAAAGAFAERLIGRFAALAPADDPSAGPVYAFDTAAMLDGEMAWDLSEPVLAPRAVTLASNPLETARQASAKGFTLSREAPVVPFATGLHVISISPNLPPKRIGALMVGAEIRVPPFLPDRPQTVTASALFREGETSKTVNIRLSPAEPVAFDYQAVVFVAGPAGAQRLTGPVLRRQGTHLTIVPDSFPVRFLRIDATPTLLDALNLHIRCTGNQGGKPWSIEADLTRTTGALAFAVPREIEDGALGVSATTPDGGRTLTLDPRPLEDCWLDLSSFPTAGPARVDVTCEFDDTAGLAAIECAPEDRLDQVDAVGLVRLTPAAPSREWRWLVTNPLLDGFHWRWFRPSGEAPEPWSERLDRASGPLALRSSRRAGASTVMEEAR